MVPSSESSPVSLSRSDTDTVRQWTPHSLALHGKHVLGQTERQGSQSDAGVTHPNTQLTEERVFRHSPDRRGICLVRISLKDRFFNAVSD